MNIFNRICKPLTWFTALLMIAALAGCGGTDTVLPASSGNAITNYSFVAYPGAPVTITQAGVVKSIDLTLPFGTNLTALVATFKTTGANVTVATVVQTSGVTPNNFGSPVTYSVTAANGIKTTYVVTVTVAPNTAKALSRFSFVGFPGAPGVISEPAHTIAVTLPFGTPVTALTASFATTGASVTVGGVTQVTDSAPTNDFTLPVQYTVHAADTSTAIYTVTVSLAANPAKAITTFSIVGYPGSTGFITEPAHSIAVTLPVGTPVMALVASYSTTGSVVTVAGLAQTSGTTPNSFANPVLYTVFAADTSTAIYTVTVSFAAANPTPPVLGEAGRFVILAPAAITTTGITAISNADIGISPAARSLMTGFTPVGAAGGVAELVNGTTYAANDANPAPFPLPLHFSTPVVGAPWTSTAAMLTQANTDLGIADTFLGFDPNPSAVTQVCPTELGGLTLTPGVYKTAANVLVSTGALTLDGQGNPNAVFIFSIGGTLGTGAPGGNIVLVNGALAKNVYWRTAGITTIGAATIFKGQVFAATQVNVNSGANITGSLYAITDRVTLIATTLTKAP
ncbi:MAG: ice-binding family protein [Gallionella sp.]|nr:ice-binding family protein [Gallionella sp.]